MTSEFTLKLMLWQSLAKPSSLAMLTVSKQGQKGKEEGRPSRWRDGLARSFVHGSTHHC
ncbi:hypothetical protein SynPROSU1_00679 [Synechococcus sp. PROS-U-1]|nr:hypothetical protein SynPROSU1_00679 [Synechococcus sp. PROS-U-1]